MKAPPGGGGAIGKTTTTGTATNSRSAARPQVLEIRRLSDVGNLKAFAKGRQRLLADDFWRRR